MRVIEGAEMDEAAPAALADDCPFTFLPGYRRFLVRSGFEPVLLRDGSGAMAPLALFRNRLLRLGRILSPPRQSGRRLSVGRELAFCTEAGRVLHQQRVCDRLVQPPNFALFQGAPAGSPHCRFGSFVLALQDRTEDEVFGAFHAHHRRGIRQAIRAGATVRTGRAQLEPFCRLHEETMRRSGMPFTGQPELDALWDALAPDHILCAVAYAADGRVQGGLVAPFTRHSAYYIWGASAARPQVPGAIKLAHWEAIRWLMARGVRAYDFVGARVRDVGDSKLKYIQEFKSRFGAELKQGFLWKQDLNAPRVRLYELASAVRSLGRRLAGHGSGPTDIIDQEIAWSRRSSG